jgi:hypothetical protein
VKQYSVEIHRSLGQVFATVVDHDGRIVKSFQEDEREQALRLRDKLNFEDE